MTPTLVINAVGLTPDLLEFAPRVRALASSGSIAQVREVLPAVTCPVQSTYLSGLLPQEHGVVGNGWYFREEAEVRFWRQSNHLVSGTRLWHTARRRDPRFTCANLFWWFAMYAEVDTTVTPRPMYPADGRKLPDIWTHPSHLRRDLQERLGRFPLFKFWGPAAGIESTRWITSAALAVPTHTLKLVYLPHLDYALQKLGPGHPRIATEVAALDGEIGRLIDSALPVGHRVLIVSEYGITAVDRPVHLNRVLREQGWLVVREELGRELLDAGASAAFAVADHQVAHVYLNDQSLGGRVEAALRQTPGVAATFAGEHRTQVGLDHHRSGDIVVLAEPRAWFTYYYWTDDDRAPDFARTVDIHRKPGYDPVELFIDPGLRLPGLRIAATLAKRRLGMRSLLDVIPLDAKLVRGSHGLRAASPRQGPLVISSVPGRLPSRLEATEVCRLILDHVFDHLSQ